MRLRDCILFAGVGAACGCFAHKAGTRSPASPATSAALPPKAVRLAVLPVESDGFPEVAEWLSNLLGDVRVAGVDEYFKPHVALEVVQLSIECVEATAQCYTQVGKSLEANRLLMATISGGSGRRRERSIRVRVVLFDVDRGVELTAAEKQFKNKDEALADAEDLVKAALGSRKQAAAGPAEKRP
jgi:hypothetical protein